MILDAVFLWFLVINNDTYFRNVKDLERYNSTSEPIKVLVLKGVPSFKFRLFFAYGFNNEGEVHDLQCFII